MMTDTPPLFEGRPARVLLIDDNRPYRENLEEILLDQGYDVATASSSAEALALADGGFEVALVDLRLPDGEGSELARALKSRVATGEIILLTGYATVESAAQAVRAGACAYLVKPSSTPQLLLAVEQALRQVRLHLEKEALSKRALVMEKLAAVGTLTAGLSHEIRNPLNAAGLQLTVLKRRVQRLPEEVRATLSQPLELVEDEIRRLDHILEDFLQFARPRELTLSSVDLDGLLGGVLHGLQARAGAREVRLETLLPPELAVRGDRDRLEQVLVNLALNALEAAPRGGFVRVGAQEEPGWITLWVEDDGPGVSPTDRARIFEPFFTTKASGSGLGLPIVHAIVTQHGGDISVEEAADGGARFVVRLPQAAPALRTGVA